MFKTVSNCLVVAVVQARSSSARLSNKVMQPVLGKPMLVHQLERIQRCKRIDKLIVATSDQAADDELAKTCQNLGYCVARGSLNNVLERFYMALKNIPYDHLVRLTGDCPLVDPELVDRVIIEHLNNNADYTSNVLVPSFPDGLDVEVLKKRAFALVFERAQSFSQLEHVTSYIYENPQSFKIHKVASDTDLSFHRWTVDEPVDFELITKIYEGLYPMKPDFLMDDVLDFIKVHSSELPKNSHIIRNEGYIESLNKNFQPQIRPS